MEGFGDVLKRRRERQKKRGGVKAQLIEYIGSLPIDERRKDGWHVSQIFSYCARAVLFDRLLSQVEKVALAETRKADDAGFMTFGIGKAVHWWFQNVVYGPAGWLRGRWRCIKCGRVVEGFWPGYKCDSCGKSMREGIEPWRNVVWLYQEPRVRNEELGIVGSIDGYLSPDKDIEWVWELKTMNPIWFEKLTEVQDSHRRQLVLYLWLFKKEWGLIQYINKGHQRGVKVCIKEFVIKPDEEIVKEAIEKVNLLNETVEAKVFPARDCPTVRSPKAKRCIFAGICFDDDKVREIEEKAENTSLPSRAVKVAYKGI